MAYNIAYIIYGIPLSEERDVPLPKEDGYAYPSFKRSEKLEAWINNDSTQGLLSYYSGNSNTRPAAFGINVAEFDETQDIMSLEELETEDIISQFNELYQQLDEDLQKEINHYGQPRLFLLWGTS